ncbi:MAG: hypothetical protein RLO12_01400 [Fulvivirga sp.]
MKNIKLLALISVAFFFSCNNSEKQKNAPLRHVGDILFDPKIDTTDFQPCHEDLTFQYYNFSSAIQYDGEKAKVLREFDRQFQAVDEYENGYVTIRFIVNCDGKTGWYRIVTMDLDYNEKNLSKELTNQLLEITKSLDGWKPGDFDGKNYDYYQYLTFKITNGDIERIMP